MVKTVDWALIKNKATRKSLFYLNDYPQTSDRLRIEDHRGGERCLWRAKTTMVKMEETKRFLEKCWKLDKRESTS